MTQDEARAVVRRCLENVVPGAGGDALAADADLRDALDLDSMDVFDVVAAIADDSGVNIPDREVGNLRSIDAFADFLLTAQAAR